MGEFKTLIVRRPLSYSGLFDMSELYKVIDVWLNEHHYDKVERLNHEDVTEEGKQVVLLLLPFKKFNDYAKTEIGIYVEFTNLKEEVIERNGIKRKFYRGDISFSFDCNLTTDYEGHWETKPVYFFFRTLIEKYVYKAQNTEFEGQATSDCEDLIKEIKAYLNMQRFK